MTIKKESRRRHISFKNNIQDKDLLKFFDEKSTIYGRSNYIKILIQQDQMLKEYMDSLGVLFEETEDRFNDYHQDYETPIASEHKEVLTKTKTKMKTLGKQYQVNKK